MIDSGSPSPSTALGFADLDRLRLQAGKSPEAGIKGVARQFEAQFLQMMLKSMRDATPQDGILDSEQMKTYTSMLDQQLAQDLSRSGIGIADILAKQLQRTVGNAAQATGAAGGTTSAGSAAGAAGSAGDAGAASGGPSAAHDGVGTAAAPGPSLAGTGGSASAPAATPVAANPATNSAARPSVAHDGAKSAARPRNDRRAEFVRSVLPDAQAVSAETGIPARFLVAQAALESGWGRHEPRTADGGRSYNLLGIKAGRSWGGEVARASTTEFVGGTAQRTTQPFRAYGSYAEAFRDYARLLRENPRYAAVLQRPDDPVAFAHGLQRAGYATDPQYSAKLGRILGTTLTA